MNIYKKNNLTIIQDDILKSIRYINDKSIDLIFADPPYNIGKNFNGLKDSINQEEFLIWCYLWIDECFRILKPTGTMYLMNSTENMPFLDIYCRNIFCIKSRIVWCYDSSGVQAKKFFGSLYEPILMMVKNKNDYTFNTQDILVEAKTGSKRNLIDYRKKIPTQYNSTKLPGNVWNFNRVRFKMQEYQKHPTQKPEILLERIIKASSNVNDIVLDPFSGSFTTGKVAKELNRKFIGIEINNEYVMQGIKRIF